MRDKVLVGGRPDALIALTNYAGFERIGPLLSAPDDWLATLGVVEVLVHPEAIVAGVTVNDALAGWSEDLHVLGLIRDQEPLTDLVASSLKPGDRLLIVGPWSDIDALTDRHDEFVLLTFPAERSEVRPAKGSSSPESPS